MKKYLTNVLFALITVFCGIFVLAKPNLSINLVALAFAIILVVRGLKGICDVVRFKKVSAVSLESEKPLVMETKKRVRVTMLVNAIISLVIGIVVFSFSIVAMVKDSRTMRDVMVYIAGGGFLLSGIIGIVQSSIFHTHKALRENFSYHSFLYILAGVVCFVAPNLVGSTALIILGCILVALGLMDVVYVVATVLTEKRVKKEFESKSK